ncbi:MAG: calcium/sodium antiporter [Chloroflexaceae bacterium]|nr:calcium/sodium antiporter [Chloroflexaceae bacterium]
MDWLTIVLFVLGLGLLVGGAELLVRGASSLATAVGISPLVIGLTVVSFGTSSPELAVSLQSAMAGQPALALGNVIGSNIFNVLFILGVCALITPLFVQFQLIRLDVPLMIVISLILFGLAFDGGLSRFDGLLLVVGLLAYLTFTILASRKANVLDAQTTLTDEVDRSPRGLAIAIGIAVVGLALLMLGAQWLVAGAISFARLFGISELVIGLTIVAVGTSLPEVATSVVAALRGERDIAVGNVVGSNIFNILGILGITAVIAPIQIAPAAIGFDLPVMVAVAIASLPIFFSGQVIARWEGAVLLGCYFSYVIYLILTASSSTAIGSFNLVMLVVLPLTLLLVLTPAVLALLRKQPRISDPNQV